MCVQVPCPYADIFVMSGETFRKILFLCLIITLYRVRQFQGKPDFYLLNYYLIFITLLFILIKN